MFFNKLKRFLYENIIALRSSPHDLALGLALGVFIGFQPIMGFQTVVVLPLAILFRASKVTSAVGVWVSNPVTFIPFYYFNFRMGRWLLGNPDVEWDITHCDTLWEVLELGWDVLYPLWLGCVILGALSLPLVYFMSYRFVVFYRERHHRKMARNEAK